MTTDLFLRALLAGLLTYRVTQLLVVDFGPGQILFKMRLALGVYDIDKSGKPTKFLGRLFHCPYCLGVWVAGLAPIPVLVPTPLGDALLAFGAIIGLQTALQDHSRR